MNSRSKVIWAIVIAIVLIGGGIFTYAYYAGWLSPKADVISNINSNAEVMLAKANNIIVTLPSGVSLDDTSTTNQKTITDLTKQAVDAKAEKISGTKKSVYTIDGENEFNDFLIVYVDQAGNILKPQSKTSTTKSVSQETGESTSTDLTFTMDDTWTDQQKHDLQTLIDTTYPKLKEIYGDPYKSNDVVVTRLAQDPNGGCSIGGLYNQFVNPRKISFCIINDDIQNTNKVALIHEITHAFHDTCTPYWDESMTETAAQLVYKQIDTIINSDWNYFTYPKFSTSFFDSLRFGYPYTTEQFRQLYYSDINFFKNYNQYIYGKCTNNLFSLSIGADDDNDTIYAKVASRDVLSLLNSIQTINDKSIKDWFAEQSYWGEEPSEINPFSFNTSFYTMLLIGGHNNDSELGIVDTIKITSDSKHEATFKIYDFNDTLLREKDIVSADYQSNFPSGYIVNLTMENLMDINLLQLKQRFKFVLDDGATRTFYLGFVPTSEQRGIYGYVTNMNDGEISVKKLDDPSQPTYTTTIKNGAYAFVDSTYPQGKYEISYTFGGKTYTKVVSKFIGNYYVALNAHSDTETSSITNSLNAISETIGNTDISLSYTLPYTMLSYVAVYGKSGDIYDYYYETRKQYTNNVNVTISNLTPGKAYTYDVYVFYPDGFMVKHEKDFIATSSTPTPTPTTTSTITPTSSPSPTYQPISAQDIKIKKGSNSITFPYIEGSVKIEGAEKGDYIAYYNPVKKQYEFYDAMNAGDKIKPSNGYYYISRKEKTITISGYEIKSSIAVFLPTSGYYYIGNPFTKKLDVSRITVTYPDKTKPGVIKTTSLLNAVKAGLIDKNLYTQLNSTPTIIKYGFKLPAFKGYWLKTKSSNISIVFNP